MRILHTSDWHLGKKLEGRSRLPEQKEFLKCLEQIIDDEKIDIILISGDIYDTYNPPAEAERIFYDSLKVLSRDGEVAIVIISGNHDSPQRLGSITTLAKDYGVIIFEDGFQIIPEGRYGLWDIRKSVKGGIFLERGDKKVYIYTLPFPSETTFNHTFEKKSFHETVREVLEEGVSYNDEKGIPTIVMAHIYVAGSMNEGEGSLELGGAKAISIRDLPDVDYIALGHVHRAMEFKEKKAYYAGSPIEYRVTENKYNKSIYIADIESGKSEVKRVYLENYKPIKEYYASNVEEAIELSEKLKGKGEWIYLKIKLDTPLTSVQIRKIKENRDILEIIPEIELEEQERVLSYSDENIEEAFVAFFKEESDGLSPSENIKRLFYEALE